MDKIFNIGRKEVLISYVSYSLKFLSSLIVLPFILSSISTEDFAIWSIFLAINTLVLLLDMGYGVVISRYTMYAYSGAENLDVSGISKPSINASPNYYLLYQVMLVSAKIYIKITKYAFGALLIMSIYLITLIKHQPNFSELMLAWIIFSISVCINIYILSESTILKGLGKIKELQIIIIINSLIGIVIKITLLVLELELVGLAIAYLFTAILLTIQYYRITNKVRKVEYDIYLKAKTLFDKNSMKIYNSIRSKSKGMGGVILSNFVQNQLFILVAPLFLSLELMGSYNLTWQIISIIAAIASIPFNTYLMKMGNQMISENIVGLKETFSAATFIFISIFIVGTTVLVFIGQEVLVLFNSNTQILSGVPLILLILYGIMSQSILKSINIISLSNNQDFVKSLVLSSLIIILLQIIFMNFTNNLIYIFSISVIVLASYNYWKWGRKAFELCNVKFSDLIKFPFNKIISKF